MTNPRPLRPRRRHLPYHRAVAARLSFRLRQLVHDLGTGMLLRPGLIAVGLAACGLGLVELESSGTLPPWRHGGWFFANDPGSALAVTGAIAGSMMAVVSIVYSVLLVALSLASVQFSPRILGGFVRDRLSQRTLGVFLGTFGYALLAMRAIRTDPGWVPTWAVAGACLLGLTCLVFLVSFLHHIATGIQVNHLVARIAGETRAMIPAVYDQPAGPAAPMVADGAVAVAALTDGYVQLVDHDGLTALAVRHDLTVHVEVETGDYAARGQVLARLSPRGAAPPALATTAACDAFDLGPVRTMQQDVGFGVRQLVDIALKAISPAVNDPSTAGTCIDRLGSLLAELAGHPTGPRVIAVAGVARVVVPQPSFADLVDLAMNQLRQYGRTDLAVSIRLLGALAHAGRAAGPAARAHLLHHAQLIEAGLSPTFLAADRARFDVLHARVVAELGRAA